MAITGQSLSRAFSREQHAARKQSLVEATAHCLANRGINGTSVRSICAQAGVSAGLLRHYFPTINAAIAQTYRWTGRNVQNALDSAAAAQTDSRGRLLAYLTASFSPPISDPELLATWLAFWGLSRNNPEIAAIHDDIYGEYRTKMEILIADLNPDHADHHQSAIALTALVDGLWLELSLGNAPFAAGDAANLVERWLDAILG